MKRNWAVIIAIIVLIIGYEKMVLSPYEKKYAPPPPVEKIADTPPATGQGGTMAATPGSVVPQGPKQIALTETARKGAEKVEINDSRYFSIFPDATLGDVVLTKYFTRGREFKEPIRVVENGLHWTSTDQRVERCLRSMNRAGSLLYVADVDGVKCSIKYQPANLLLGATVEVESETEIKGDLILETEDGVGDGPEFDHRYLAYKKKDEQIETVRGKTLWTEPAALTGPFDYISWGDKYFSTNILPKGKFNPNFFYRTGSNLEQRVHWGVAYPLRWTADAKKVVYEADVYFAIKDLQELRSVRADIAETIDFGFFGAIARFMLWSLESLFKIFKNYGIAIIILSLVIRLLLWPINKKMFESGQKMKDIQPQMEAIKKKYEGKTDQMMQMNNEIRQLYSKAGVNPLGSCLPVLIQIPIFFALNSALSNSVDLYQAPFFGWITDLSYKDPLYILPIVWTISLIISVELNPQPQSQPGMPDMKWISRVMFIVFGFISKDFPSGLNLYFLVSNLAGMVQQWHFKKKTQMAGQNILLGKER